METLEEAVLAVAEHDVADSEEAAEHHVHSEDARKQPVKVACGGACDGLALGPGRGGEQQFLHDVALG